MLSEELEVPALQDPEALSKSRLRNESECITLGESGDRIVDGNSRGHGLLQRLDEMDRTMKSLTARNERKTSQIEVVVQESSRAPDSQLGRLCIDSEAVLSSIKEISAAMKHYKVQMRFNTESQEHPKATHWETLLYSKVMDAPTLI